MSPRYPADVSDRPWQVNCYEPLLGTRVDIAIQADDPDAAHRADERAQATIEQLTGVFSLYDPDSELCMGRRGEVANPGDELVGVLEQAEHWYRLGTGTFHPACAALRRHWLAAEHHQRRPNPAELQDLANTLRPLPFRTTRRDGRVHIERVTDCGDVDLNAIAKGHIVDRAVAAARADDAVHTVVVSAGGDLRHAGHGDAVPVNVEDPHRVADNAPPIARFPLAEAAVATSGSTRRGFRIGSESFGHVIDPRTGWPVADTMSATVRAPSALVADAVATIAMVLAPHQGIAFVDRLPEAVAALLVEADGTQHVSARWPTGAGVSR